MLHIINNGFCTAVDTPQFAEVYQNPMLALLGKDGLGLRYRVAYRRPGHFIDEDFRNALKRTDRYLDRVAHNLKGYKTQDVYLVCTYTAQCLEYFKERFGAKFIKFYNIYRNDADLFQVFDLEGSNIQRDSYGGHHLSAVFWLIQNAEALKLSQLVKSINFSQVYQGVIKGEEAIRGTDTLSALKDNFNKYISGYYNLESDFNQDSHDRFISAEGKILGYDPDKYLKVYHSDDGRLGNDII